MNTHVDQTKVRLDPHDRSNQQNRQAVDYLFEPFVLPELNYSDSSSDDDTAAAPSHPQSTSSHPPTDPAELSKPDQPPPISTDPLSSALIAHEPNLPTHHDPLVRRLFVLAVVRVDFGEPTPKISTFTWSFSSQYRTFIRVLMKMLEISRTRDNDAYDVFDEDEHITEDLTALLDFEPVSHGLNGYTENIPQQQMGKLVDLHQRVSRYFVQNNNIHSGLYDSFSLSRHLINDHERKTYSRDITNLQIANQTDIEAFFKQ